MIKGWQMYSRIAPNNVTEITLNKKQSQPVACKYSVQIARNTYLNMSSTRTQNLVNW